MAPQPISLPIGSPALRYLSRFPLENRSEALECVTLFGLNALLTAYSIDELTFKNLNLVTEQSCRSMSKMLDRMMMHKPKSFQQSSKEKPTQTSKKHQQSGRQHSGDKFNSVPCTRPDVLKAWPFVDEEGTMTDILTGNDNHDQGNIEEKTEAHPGKEHESKYMKKTYHKKRAPKDAAPPPAASLPQKYMPVPSEASSVQSDSYFDESNDDSSASFTSSSNQPPPVRRGSGTNSKHAKAVPPPAPKQSQKTQGNHSNHRDKKDDSQTFWMRKISQREQLRRLDKTLASYSNFHTNRRISKFELTEALDEFGLQMSTSDYDSLPIKPLQRSNFGIDHDNATNPQAYISELQFRGLVNSVLVLRGCETLPIPPALLQGAQHKAQNVYDKQDLCDSEEEEEEEDDSYFKGEDDDEEATFDSSGMMWCKVDRPDQGDDFSQRSGSSNGLKTTKLAAHANNGQGAKGSDGQGKQGGKKSSSKSDLGRKAAVPVTVIGASTGQRDGVSSRNRLVGNSGSYGVSKRDSVDVSESSAKVPSHLRGVKSKIKEQVRQEQRFQQKSMRASRGAVADIVLESHESHPRQGYLRGGPNTNMGSLEQREKNSKYQANPSKVLTGHWEAIADYMLQSDLLPEACDQVGLQQPRELKTNYQHSNHQYQQQRTASFDKQNQQNASSFLSSSMMSSPIRSSQHTQSNARAEQRRQQFEQRYQARHGRNVRMSASGDDGQTMRGASGGASSGGSHNYSGWIGDFGNLNSFTVPPIEEPIPSNHKQTFSGENQQNLQNRYIRGGRGERGYEGSGEATVSFDDNDGGKDNERDVYESKYEGEEEGSFEERDEDNCGQGDIPSNGRSMDEEEEDDDDDDDGETGYSEEKRDEDKYIVNGVSTGGRLDGVDGDFSLSINDSVAVPWTSPLDFNEEKKQENKDDEE